MPHIMRKLFFSKVLKSTKRSSTCPSDYYCMPFLLLSFPVIRGPFSPPPPPPVIRGHRKNRREGGTEKCDRVGGKNMASGRATTWKNREGVRRAGELSKIFLKIFFLTQKVHKNLHHPGVSVFFLLKTWKNRQIELAREGVKYFFLKSSYWVVRKKAAGRGTYQRKSQPMGIPPLPPPPPLPTCAPPPPPLSRSAHTVISHFSLFPMVFLFPLCTSAYETSIMCFSLILCREKTRKGSFHWAAAWVLALNYDLWCTHFFAKSFPLDTPIFWKKFPPGYTHFLAKDCPLMHPFWLCIS